MKTTFRIIGTLYFMAMLCLLNGCLWGYNAAPTHLYRQIVPADHIVVTNSLAGHRRMGYENFSKTITGQDAKEVIRAISTLREHREGFCELRSSTYYEWHLQFYRGTKLLGTADLDEGLVQCDDEEYRTSETLKELYNSIAKESGELPTSSSYWKRKEGEVR